MSRGLWVRTERLCPWSRTEKQRASCGPAHFHSDLGQSVSWKWPGSRRGSHSLSWRKDPELSVHQAPAEGGVMENKPRRQPDRGHHGKQRDRSSQACGELLSDIRMHKCVSGSAPALTRPFAPSVPSVLPMVTLSCLSRCITRPSVTSAPTPTPSSSTPPSSTSGPAQVQHPGTHASPRHTEAAVAHR